MQLLHQLAKLKGDNQISCIIPAWNEEKNISKVIKVVKDFPSFDEVIVVDDGSTDQTAEIVKKYKNIKLISHQKNLGKTAAVLTGISESAGNLIVLLDADLIGLTHENIAKMLVLILKGEYDLAILDRAGDRSAIWGWTNCARFFSGERCFWKKDFLEINLPEESGYLLEIIMNLHYIGRHKRIRNIYCENLYMVPQPEKFGALRGYCNYFRIGVKIVRKATVKGFLRQVKAIEEDHRYFIEYNKLLEKINFKKYRGLKEKSALISRLKELQKRFSFGREKFETFTAEWKGLPDRIKYKQIKEKINEKSRYLRESLTKLIKI